MFALTLIITILSLMYCSNRLLCLITSRQLSSGSSPSIIIWNLSGYFLLIIIALKNLRRNCSSYKKCPYELMLYLFFIFVDDVDQMSDVAYVIVHKRNLRSIIITSVDCCSLFCIAQQYFLANEVHLLFHTVCHF